MDKSRLENDALAAATQKPVTGHQNLVKMIKAHFMQQHKTSYLILVLQTKRDKITYL